MPGRHIGDGVYDPIFAPSKEQQEMRLRMLEHFRNQEIYARVPQIEITRGQWAHLQGILRELIEIKEGLFERPLETVLISGDALKSIFEHLQGCYLLAERETEECLTDVR